MTMNRQEFYSRYREARKAIRFYGDMKDATGAMIATMFDTLDLCPLDRQPVTLCTRSSSVAVCA